MGYNIGPKIGIEGEKEFQTQIKAINNEYKTLQAQTKALTAEFDKNNNQQGKLEMQTQQLEKQIDAQKRAIEEMEKALEVARNTTDANSDAITSWEGKLWNAKATVAQLEKELAETEDALQKMENGIEDTGDAAEEAGKGVSKFGDILKGNLAADVIWDAVKEGADLLVDLGKEALSTASELRAEESQFAQTFGEMEQTATTALQNVEKQTGISATRIKGNFSTVYAFAKTMGSDSEEAIDIASRAMAAAADSAAYYDKTVEEVTETIQAYIKGNYANDAALGIASTETTRNAAALERYGKAFKELTESQKIDTLLAMVEAGNKASGAMGQAAREAGEWTNVTGELEDAQKQLLGVIGEPILEAAIPVVQELTESLREMAEVRPGEQLERDMEGFVQTMEDAEAAYNSTAASTMATATVAQRYVEQLQALEQSGLATAEAHAEYEAVVTKLNAIMPELNVTIDEQTGLINQNTQALLGDIEVWKEMAIQQALYDKMKGQLEAYGKAQMTVAEAQVKLNEITGFYDKDLQQLADTLGVTGAAYIETAKYAETGASSAGALFYVFDKNGKKLAEFSANTKGVSAEAMKLAGSIAKQQVEIVELNSEIQSANDTIQEYEAEMDRLTGLIEENTNNTQDNADAQQEQKQAIAETQAALLELETAYQEAEKSTRSMLDSSIGLWDEMANESEWSAQKIWQNWVSQSVAFSEYGLNLKKAKQIGLADGIIEELSDGTQESMQIVDALVNQSEISVELINDAFAGLNRSKDSATDALMSLDTSLQEGYDKLVEDAKAAGVEIVDGIAQAISDNAHKVGEALDVGEYQADAESLAEVVSPLLPRAMSTTPRQVISNYITFEITQMPGESGEELAQRVAEIMQDDYVRRGGGLGR